MAYLQFLSRQTVVRFWAILVMVNLLSAGIFPADCRAWIFFHKPEYKGKVIDAETEEPVEGVAVVAVYYKRGIIGIPPDGPISWSIHWKEALTDANGIFRIPSYTTLVGPNSYADKTEFIFYKPGYRSSPVWPNFLRIVGADKFLTEEIGKTGETSWGTAEETSPEGKTRIIPKHHSTFTYGVIKLKPANTYDERLRSTAISTPTCLTEDDHPTLHKYLKNEIKWLRHNKEWRRHEEDN